MNFLTIVATLVFAMSFTARGETCVDGTKISESKNPVVEAENADHVGFCGNFAARDLLHQAICKTAKTAADCFQPAVMDGLELMADLALSPDPKAQFVGADESMKLVLERGLTTEECNSFNRFFKPENLSTKYYDIRKKYAARTFRVKFEQCKKEQLAKRELSGCSEPERPVLHQQLQQAVELFCQADTQKDMPTSEGYLNRAIQAWEKNVDCPKKHIFPSLIMKSKPLPQDDAQLAKEINERLDAGYPVQVTRKGPHSFVIANYRIVCRSGRQTMQYQVIDSLYGSVFSATNKPVDWADAAGFSIGPMGWGILNKLDHHYEMHWLESNTPKSK